MIALSDNNQFEAVLQRMTRTYREKNAAYGDSFTRTIDDFGIGSAFARISDKTNRLRSLYRQGKTADGDESIKDTLLDLANYAAMTLAYIEAEEDKPLCVQTINEMLREHRQFEFISQESEDDGDN